MTKFVGGVTLPPVSKEFLDTMDASFMHPDIVPGFDRDDALFKAGQRSVVEWVKQHASIAHSPDPVAAQKAAIRYGS